MKSSIFLSVIICFLTGFTMVSLESDNLGMINWMSSERVEQMRKTTPRKTFSYYYDNNLKDCQNFDSSTLMERNVIWNINTDFYAMRIKGDQLDLKSIGADTVTFPLVIFRDEEDQIVSKNSGFLKAHELMQHINFVSGEYYQDMSFSEYLQRAE